VAGAARRAPAPVWTCPRHIPRPSRSHRPPPAPRVARHPCQVQHKLVLLARSGCARGVTGAARCGRRALWCEWCAPGPRAGGSRPRPRVSPVTTAKALTQSPGAAGPACRPSPLPGPLVAVEMPFSSTFSAAAGAAELLRGWKVAQNFVLLALSNVAERGIGSRGHALAMGLNWKPRTALAL
jgi:hypothetical protein